MAKLSWPATAVDSELLRSTVTLFSAEVRGRITLESFDFRGLSIAYEHTGQG